MSEREIVIGTRGSRLALAQAELVAEAFRRAGWSCRLSVIVTAGDRRAPDTAWGEGAFVAAIERALLTGEVDVAVHSAKDVPTDEDRRLAIGAYLPRADPRDALVVRADGAARRLADLPPGTRVGTDSPRRTGFVLAHCPDLIVHPLHGNVDTRLRRLDDGETDALVLACAGLDRLGLGERIAERLDPDVVPPAPGQGAIAVQVRGDDPYLVEASAVIDDRRTRLAVESERAFLAACGGGCRAPIGALGSVTEGELTLLGGVARPDGSGTALERRRGPADASSGHALALALAEALGRAGGGAAAATDGGVGERPAAPRILVTRAAEQAGELLAALSRHGLEPVSVPAIEVQVVALAAGPGGPPDWRAYTWIVATSANGARAVLEAVAAGARIAGTVRWAAIGAATAALLEAAGLDVSFRPTRSDGMTLATELPARTGDRVLLVRGDLADGELASRLRERDVSVAEVIAYRTHEAPASSRRLLRRALDGGPIDAVVFTSGSTVRGLVALARSEAADLSSVPAVCIGPETAAAARDAGFAVAAVAAEPGAEALAMATARATLAQPLEVR